MEDKINVKVHINAQYDKTQNLNITQDVYKSMKINTHPISITDLRNEIIKAFINLESLEPLFENEKEWQWKIYSYDRNQADIEIENDDDLETEMDEFTASEDKASGDILRQLLCVELRLNEYYDTFKEQEFHDISTLCSVNNDDLKELGVTKMGHRKQILNGLEKFKQSCTASTSLQLRVVFSKGMLFAYDYPCTFTEMHLNLVEAEETKEEYLHHASVHSYDTEDEMKNLIIKCEGLCNKSYNPKDLFFCHHIECRRDIKILCYHCGSHKHKFQLHRFDQNRISVSTACCDNSSFTCCRNQSQ